MFGQLSIPSQTTTTKVVFEGIRGPGYAGDIGLDDIKMKNGLCQSTSMMHLSNLQTVIRDNQSKFCFSIVY